MVQWIPWNGNGNGNDAIAMGYLKDVFNDTLTY